MEVRFLFIGFLVLLSFIPNTVNAELLSRNGVKTPIADHDKSSAAAGISAGTGGQRRELGQIDSAIDGKWQQFRHWAVGSQALTCGSACIPGLNSEYAPPAPWEFELPAGGGCFLVVDAFEASDQYNVTDFENITIGTTSDFKGTGSCGKDPENCFSSRGVSKGSFFLAEGPHSVMITVAQGDAGSAFFRVVTDLSMCKGVSSPTTAPVDNIKSPAPSAPVVLPDSPAPTTPVVSPDSPAPTAPVVSPDSPAPTAGPVASPSPTNENTKNRSPIAKCKPKVVWPAMTDCATRVSIDDGSYDPDDGDTISFVQKPWGPYKVGTRNVTLTVTDNAGNSDSCVTQVTVVDSEKIDLDSIDCGISDWHVQPCDPPVTYSASYKISSAKGPNTKQNGCPVTLKLASKDMNCERCAGVAERNRIVDVNCGNSVSVSGNDIILSSRKGFGYFMSWEVIASDRRGRSVSKQCGVCVETGGECRRAEEKGSNEHNESNDHHLKRRVLAEVFTCPGKIPESSDGSMTWPEHSLTEIDNCASILGN